MALTKQNWTLNSYTNNTWTTLVTGEALVNNFVMTNTTAGAIDVSIRLDDGTNNLAAILSTYSLAAGSSEVLDVRNITVLTGQEVSVFVSAAGVEFIASGVV